MRSLQVATGFLVVSAVFFYGGFLVGQMSQSTVITTQNIIVNKCPSVIPSAEFNHSHDSTPKLPTKRARKKRVFSDDQIRATFAEYIEPKMKNETYLHQYQWLLNETWFPPEFDKDYWIHAGGPKGKYFDIARIVQSASFREYIFKYHLLQTHCDHVLTFNPGWDPEMQYFSGWFSKTHNISKCEHFTSIHYKPPTDTRGDLYVLDLKYKQWDLILLPQFLEHLYDNALVMKNLFEHLRVGGYLYVSVPTMNIPHLQPFHFQHLQPMGLAMLALKAGFEIKEIDFWGVKGYMEIIFKHRWWPTYNKYFPYEPLVNDPLYTCQTWGLFQRVT